MFYLCSIGSNLDPHQHVSQAVGELLVHFGRLQLSSVIQTKPVGMHSSHDFLNCLFVAESELAPHQLKAHFVAMELAHARIAAIRAARCWTGSWTSTSWPAARAMTSPPPGSMPISTSCWRSSMAVARCMIAR